MPKKTSQPGHNDAFNAALITTIALGLVLRLWGIFWSLPGLSGYSRHPDEAFQVLAASNIDVFSLQLNPQFYNYGAMYMYLVSLPTSIAAAWGWISPDSLADRYLIARLVTALLGAAIPYFVFRAATRLYDRKVGLLAAFLAAITPIAVVHSHFATVDIPAAFWTAVCLAVSAGLARKYSLSALLLAGLFAGFAGATKYTAIIVIAAPIAAAFTRTAEAPTKIKITSIIWVLLSTCAGFVIGNPGSILWPDQFLSGVLYEFAHARGGHGLVFEQTGPGWLFHIRSSLLFGIGLPYLILSVAGLCVIIARRGKESLYLILFAVLYFAAISISEVRFARYIIPLAPVLAIAGAAAIAFGFDSIFRMQRGSVRARQMLLAGCLVVTVGAIYYTFAYTVALNRLFKLKDPRVAAVESIPKGSTVALPTAPWFYSPAFSPGFTEIAPAARLAAMAEVKDHRLMTNPEKPWDTNLLLAERPGYVIVSDYEDLDALRVKDGGAVYYLGALRVLYSRSAVIANRLKAGGISFGPTERLPHDLKYVSPRLTIYKRRS